MNSFSSITPAIQNKIVNIVYLMLAEGAYISNIVTHSFLFQTHETDQFKREVYSYSISFEYLLFFGIILISVLLWLTLKRKRKAGK